MKKIHQLDQGKTQLCTAFACFGVLQYNFGLTFTNEYIFDWCKKNNVGDDNNLIRVARWIAKAHNVRCETFRVNSDEFRGYLSKGKAVAISLNVPKSLWKDAIDGNIDNYDNNELPGSKHSIYAIQDVTGEQIINSWGDRMKPHKVDFRHFKPHWFHLVNAITFLPK